MPCGPNPKGPPGYEDEPATDGGKGGGGGGGIKPSCPIAGDLDGESPISAALFGAGDNVTELGRGDGAVTGEPPDWCVDDICEACKEGDDGTPAPSDGEDPFVKCER